MLIVVVLAAIIMSIGIPSYRQYTMRANRADATSALLRIAAAQERFFLDEDTYTTNLADLGFDPPQTERGYYSLAIAPRAGGIAAGYLASGLAVPGKSQADDTECTAFSIDETGRRGSAPGDPDLCWR
jgi:type IV pilus assembly protein PilE